MNTLRIHHTMTVMAIVVVTVSLLLFQYYDVSFASAYMTDPVITITDSPPPHTCNGNYLRDTAVGSQFSEP